MGMMTSQTKNSLGPVLNLNRTLTNVLKWMYTNQLKQLDINSAIDVLELANRFLMNNLSLLGMFMSLQYVKMLT